MFFATNMYRMPRQVALTGAVLVAACATSGQPPVRDIPLYREQVLRDQMDPARLPEQVRAEARGGPARVAFHRMVVSYESTRSENGRSEVVTVRETVISAGDGLFRQQAEWLSNGLPYRINTRLMYGGVVPLRFQTMFVNRKRAEPLGDTLAVDRFSPDVRYPAEGGVYEFEFLVGERGQPVLRTFTCKAGTPTQASDVHPKLSGLAYELACEVKDRGVARETLGYILLEDYGLALQTDFVAPHVKEPRKIVDVVITP
jgi:hypothetical protein